MEGILNVLKSEGIELTEDAKKNITKSLATEYKSIVEYNNLKNKLDDLKSQLSDKSKIEEEINNLKNENTELTKLYENSKNMGYKFDTLKKGVNEKFVDFIVSDILKNKSDDENFSNLLDGYISENPQYLTDNYIKLNTTPKYSPQNNVMGTNELINNLIRGK